MIVPQKWHEPGALTSRARRPRRYWDYRTEALLVTSLKDAEASAPHDPATGPVASTSPAEPSAATRTGNVTDETGADGRRLLGADELTPMQGLLQRQAAARAAGRAARRAATGARQTAASTSRARGAAHAAAACQTAASGPQGPVAARADDSTPAAHRGAAGQVGNLVSTAGQQPSPGPQLTRLRLKDQRRRLREAIQRLTSLEGIRCCATRLTSTVVGLHVGDGAARFSGLQSCHSVWACPVCMARIRAARSVELERAALAWLKAGHGLYMATLTVPHWEHVRLANRVKDGHRCAGKTACTCECKCELLAPAAGAKKPTCTCRCPIEPGQLGKLVEAWRGIAQGTWWVGRAVIRDGAPAPWSPEWEADERYWKQQEFGADGRPLGTGTVWQIGFKDRWDIAGTTRTIEITYGANGWHSHAHVLLWTETPATDKRGAAIQRELYQRWAQRCRAVGLPTPDPEHGVRVDAATRESAGVIGKYVIKLQEGGGSLAMEMTRADLKVARGGKGLTALELAAIAVGDGPDADRARRLWNEYEQATRGVQCLTWSHGLRERLAALVELDDRDDDELPEEEEAETPEYPDIAIARAPWRERIVPVLGARADVLHAAEVGGLPGAVAVLDKLGLVHGVDYWRPDPPAGESLPVTAAQFKRGQAVKAARVARRTAVENAVLDRTPQEWAELQERRREALETARRIADRAAENGTEDDATELLDERLVLAAAREEFLARHRAAKAGRADEIAARVARFRAAHA